MRAQVFCILAFIGTVFGGCANSGGESGSQTKITKEIIPVVRTLSQAANLTCVISQQGSNTIHWFKGSKHLFAGHSEVFYDEFNRFDVEVKKVGDNTEYTLMIKRVETGDNGEYTCQVYIQGEDPSVYPCRVGLLTIPVRPAILHSSSSIIAEVGKDVSMTCTASGTPPPVVTWTRLDGTPLPLPGTVQRTFTGSTLTLPAVQKEAKGTYKCSANNDVLSPAEAQVRLDVGFAPTARHVLKQYLQAPGTAHDAYLECIIGGVPEPTFAWYKGDISTNPQLEKLNTGSDYFVETVRGDTASTDLKATETFFRLTIKDTDNGDYGLYTCEGTNIYGTSYVIVQFIETDQCQGPKCPSQGSVRSGAQAVLSSALSAILMALFAAVCLVPYH